MTSVCPDCGVEAPVAAGRFARHGDCPGWFRRTGWAGEPTSEARFTDPRPDCPHPERWHSTDADSTEEEVTALVAAFVTALRPNLVVETGSAWGQTAQAIGQALTSGGYGGILHTIEPDPTRADFTRRRCDGLPVVVEQLPSDQFTPPGPVGFAWLDSLHHLRVPEFRQLHPHMTPGAFVGFHDTGPHQGPLRSAIEQLEAEGLLLPVFLPTPRGVAFAEVCC